MNFLALNSKKAWGCILAFSAHTPLIFLQVHLPLFYFPLIFLISAAVHWPLAMLLDLLTTERFRPPKASTPRHLFANQIFHLHCLPQPTLPFSLSFRFFLLTSHCWGHYHYLSHVNSLHSHHPPHLLHPQGPQHRPCLRLLLHLLRLMMSRSDSLQPTSSHYFLVTLSVLFCHSLLRSESFRSCRSDEACPFASLLGPCLSKHTS